MTAAGKGLPAATIFWLQSQLQRLNPAGARQVDGLLAKMRFLLNVWSASQPFDFAQGLAAADLLLGDVPGIAKTWGGLRLIDHTVTTSFAICKTLLVFAVAARFPAS